MKISEAKALHKNDSVFIFVGTNRLQGKVVTTSQQSSQRVKIDVEVIGEDGKAVTISRLQTSAYLTKETAAIVAYRQSWSRLPPDPDEASEINPGTIPGDILRCAIKLTNWMKANGHTRWKMGALQSRDNA